MASRLLQRRANQNITQGCIGQNSTGWRVNCVNWERLTRLWQTESLSGVWRGGGKSIPGDHFWISNTGQLFHEGTNPSDLQKTQLWSYIQITTWFVAELESGHARVRDLGRVGVKRETVMAEIILPNIRRIQNLCCQTFNIRVWSPAQASPSLVISGYGLKLPDPFLTVLHG